MALDPRYLEYPRRRYGMDHDLYEWSMLSRRAPVAWPNGARVALWVNVAVQFFPLNQRGKPFPPPGGMSTPYPDLRHYTLRDYGNRVGLFRCLEALDEAGLTPTFSVNAAIAGRCPQLLERLNRRGNEILASSWHMDTLHHGELAMDDERELIGRSLAALRAAVDQPVTGWLSPARSQSGNTPDLLAEAGIRYMGDWINDDMPYPFTTRHGELIALPLSLELDDQFIIQSNLHSEWEYADQVKDACDYLLAEAEKTGHGRLLALSVHPWLMGPAAPHRRLRVRPEAHFPADRHLVRRRLRASSPPGQANTPEQPPSRGCSEAGGEFQAYAAQVRRVDEGAAELGRRDHFFEIDLLGGVLGEQHRREPVVLHAHAQVQHRVAVAPGGREIAGHAVEQGGALLILDHMEPGLAHG